MPPEAEISIENIKRTMREKVDGAGGETAAALGITTTKRRCERFLIANVTGEQFMPVLMMPPAPPPMPPPG